MTFDEAVSALLDVCLRTPTFNGVRHFCVVRNLAGRLKLAIDADSAVNVAALQSALVARLGKHFEPPLLSTSGSKDEARLARVFVNDLKREWPASWPTEVADAITGETTRLQMERWSAFPRYLSKSSWLSGKKVRPPWSLSDGPSVVSFYSFKGGVGRTTLLGATAWQIARMQKTVAVIDLDLEAPGLGPLFGIDADHGSLDFLVDHIAGSIPTVRNLAHRTALLGEDGDRIFVVPAGRLGWSFIEKLSHLDFTQSDDGDGPSPCERALAALLEAVRSEIKPDVILIDARAGIHDLGGLALHALSHVDVLVTRDNAQALGGLSVAVDVLARRRELDELRGVIVVQSFVDVDRDSERGRDERRRFREHVHNLFVETIYSQFGDDDPGVDDTDAPHYPRPVPALDELRVLNELSVELRPLLLAGEHLRVVQRILEVAEVGGGADGAD